MNRSELSRAFLAVVVAALVGGCASGSKTVKVRQPPPAPKIETVTAAPAPGCVWIGGYWDWRGRWVWVPGRWVRPPRPNAIWVPAYWQHKSSGGWVWVRARWQ